jgi:hypothetical protein
VLRIAQPVRFPTDPLELVVMVTGMEVTRYCAPTPDREMFASVTSCEPAGTDGAVSRFTRSAVAGVVVGVVPVLTTGVPALNVNIEPETVFEFTSQRTVSVVVPVVLLTGSD